MNIRRRPPNPMVSVQELRYQVKAPDAKPQHILEEIVWAKELEVEQLRGQLSLLDLQKQVQDCPAPLPFLERLRTGPTQPALIAEVKKASPSKGVFRAEFNPVEIALAYEQAGASCLSVLTDTQFFQGSFEYLQAIRQAVSLPLLCKDFVIYPYQLYWARRHGADAVLLIAAILSNQDLTYFLKIAKQLGMAALVEVHTLEEFDRVLSVPGVELLGINNRNLETFGVDLAVTTTLLQERLSQCRDRHIQLVSESGLHTATDIQTVAAAGVNAVLIGESLIKDLETSPSFATESARMSFKIGALFPSTGAS
jgi:indole-3-glycerol phosphate synthase